MKTIISMAENEVLFIMDEDTSFLVKDYKYQIVTSEEKLYIIFEGSERAIRAFVILAEINWTGKSIEVFYGFNLATTLRQKYRLTCPIMIISTFGKEVFEGLARRQPEKYNILFSPGVQFLHVKDLYDKLQSLEFVSYLNNLPHISDLVIEDMLEMLLQQSGFIIDKITHDINFALEEPLLKEAIDNINSYLTNWQREKMGYASIAQEFLKKKDDNDQKGFNATKEKLVGLCNIYINERTENAEGSELEQYGKIGKVLIVEDDPGQQKVIKENLQKFFDIEVIGNSGEAIRKLQLDVENEIIAVIADWRMLEHKNGIKTEYWQEHQGYQVLVEAAKTHFVTFFSLTAEYDKNVHRIRNRLGVTIHLFKKEHIYAVNNTAQWQVFISILREKCIEVVNLISALPSAAKWKSYSEDYRKLRLSVEWPLYENEISEMATKYWGYFKDTLQLETRASINKGLQDIMPLNTLKNVLIGRRLFFILYYKFEKIRNDATLIFNPEQRIVVDGEDKSNSMLDTYAALRGNWWDADVSDIQSEFVRYNQQSKNLLKDLCIKSEDLQCFLPEEKAWLLGNGVDFTIHSIDFGDDLIISSEKDIEQGTFISREPASDELTDVEFLDEDSNEEDSFDF